jgi:proline dehydrogenase
MINEMITGILPYMPKKLVWIFSKRYVAGENIADGLAVSKRLNNENNLVTVDLLGEFIKSMEDAEANRDKYLQIIERFTSEGIKGNFSVKPTSFGLLIDKEECYGFIRAIVAKAAEKNSFIRIDMEDSQCVDDEISLFRKLKAEFPSHVGLVLQAYLRRTLDDVKSLSDMNSPEIPLNFRLCKGIYVEPEKIAFKEYEEIRQKYLEVLDYMFQNRIYVGIATHDKFLVSEAFKLIEKYQVPKTMYEFQMLYGVTPELRKSIVDKGNTMRVYVPYGKDWFGYCTRRLKENPKMATHIIKAIFVRG